MSNPIKILKMSSSIKNHIKNHRYHAQLKVPDVTFNEKAQMSCPIKSPRHPVKMSRCRIQLKMPDVYTN